VRNNPEERSSHLPRGGSLQWRVVTTDSTGHCPYTFVVQRCNRQFHYILHIGYPNESTYFLTISYHMLYRGADKSLARPTSPYILFDGEYISFDASLVIYINSTNIPPIMIINRIYESQKLLSM